MQIQNLLSKEFEFFYEDDGEGGINDSVHVLGIVFPYLVPEDKEIGAPLMMSTNEEGLFPMWMKPRMN